MKIFASINSDVYEYLKGSHKVDYQSSLSIIKELTKRGHNINLVHPSDYYIKDSKPFVKKILKLNGLELVKTEYDKIPEGDLFFLIGGDATIQENSNLRTYKWVYLNMLKKYFNKFLNNPEAEAKTEKHRLLELKEVPLIPSYIFSSKKELKETLMDKNSLVVKPISGAQGIGVNIINLSNADSVDLEGKIFQELIDKRDEKRIVFLGNDIVASRQMINRMKPWEKVPVGIEKLDYSPTQEEIKITKKIASQIGLEYGCVDLLDNKILEVNGSGTGAIAVYNDKSTMYDLTKTLCNYIEKNHST